MAIFNRKKIKFSPLNEKQCKSTVNKIIDPDNPKNSDYIPKPIENPYIITRLAQTIKKSRANNKPVIVAFGAHLIKNGLSLTLSKLIERNFITHLATNGASPIHDWEFAHIGKTEEDVRDYVKQGKFGTWDETGKYINLAIISGAQNNIGYGQTIGEMINKDRIILSHSHKPLIVPVKHPFKKYSIFNAAIQHNTPITVHPSFGQDIIYTHHLSHGASIGKIAEIDFLKYVNSISQLEGGVYISIGSAIMSPMIFEKALSMARNTAHQNNQKIENFMIIINDIKGASWDFQSQSEPPKDNPAYYERYCKTFSRMGAREVHYIKADNRNFLLSLYQELIKED